MGETLSGRSVSFSREAYVGAMQHFNVADIAHVVQRVERGEDVAAPVVNFFRDFAIVQETTNPDFEVGIAIGSLATRIELATGQATARDLVRSNADDGAARLAYDQIFGPRGFTGKPS
jgi:hypothetical protein